MAEVTNLATTPQTITEDVFWGVTLSAYTLKVPAASVELYQAAGIWKYFGSILPIGDAGVDDILTKNISIYPNPVQNRLRVESRELRVEKVEIVDLSGKTVSMFSNAGNRINVSHLPAGIYFIKIETGKGAVTRKFVKE